MTSHDAERSRAAPDAERRHRAPPDVRYGDVDAFDPSFLDTWGQRISRALHTWFRAEVHGLEHLPSEGTPFVGVGNHSGAVLIPDSLLWLGHYHSLRRTPQLLTLAHDQMFDGYPKPLARALSKLGAIRASSVNARAALERGFALQVYPGGDFDACRPFTKRNEIVFAGRKGYVEIARDAGVPIVPVVSAGGHEALIVLSDGARVARALGIDKRLRLKTLPLSLSVPWGLWVGPLPGYVPLPTKIRIRVLPPIDPRCERTIDDVDAHVRDTMQRALNEMCHGRRPWLG